MSGETLKPCPFCGARLGDNPVFATRHTRFFIPTTDPDRIDAWNTRPTPTVEGGETKPVSAENVGSESAKKLWSIRILYVRADNELAIRTAVSAHTTAAEATAWLNGEVQKKREVPPGYRIFQAFADDISDAALVFAKELDQ